MVFDSEAQMVAKQRENAALLGQSVSDWSDCDVANLARSNGHTVSPALPNLTTTTEIVNIEWLGIARPIIKAMFAVEDAISGVTKERLADPLGYVSYSKMSPQSHAWKEAQDIVDRAGNELHDLLEDIRDNALCDAYINVDYDADETAIDACEQFNDDLARGVMSVDAAVRLIGDE